MAVLTSYFASLNPIALFRSMPGAFAQGMIWGLLALGVYITYKLLDFADEIQSVSVLRAAEAVCAGCDGKNCVSCQNFKTITGQE